MARALTTQQARAIDALLAQEAGTQRQQIRQSGLPPRTFQVARNRALEAGWVVERFVPDPVLFGAPHVSIALARPVDDAKQGLGARWAEIPGASVVWQSPKFCFGVFFGPEPKGASAIGAELATGASRYAKRYAIEMSLTTPALPVYFDFEAEWSQVSGIPGLTHYPRPLPRRPRGRRQPPVSSRWRSIVGALVRAEGLARPLADPSAPGILERFTLRSAIPRALASGWLDERVFLNPPALPPYEEWALGQIVFVTGRLRPERRPEILLRTLMVGCGVHPFLFATNGADLLLATLSPAPAPAAPHRALSVAGTFARYLEGIEVTREGTAGLAAVVNHRYESILEVGGGAEAAPAPGAPARRLALAV